MKQEATTTRPRASTVGELVYQQRYSGKSGADEWQTLSAEEFAKAGDWPLTELRVLKVVEHDLKNAGRMQD